MSPASAVRWITAEAVTDHAGSYHHGNTENRESPTVQLMAGGLPL